MKKSLFLIIFLVFILLEANLISANITDQLYEGGFDLNISNETTTNGLDDEKIYIVPYIGDVDGNIDPRRYDVYYEIYEFHEENDIPLGISLYPATMHDNPGFLDVIVKMYYSDNIDLIQKGNSGDIRESNMADLSKSEQEEIILAGRERYTELLSDKLGTDEIFISRYYNQIEGSINNDTLDVLSEQGFEQYFDVFRSDIVEELAIPEDFIVVQYGISFPLEGNNPGYRNEFKTVDNLLNQINTYRREDIDLLEIRGDKIIPLWTHQQDFLNLQNLSQPNTEKWEVYTETLLILKEDPNIELINPSDISKELNLDINDETWKKPEGEKPVSKREETPRYVDITHPNRTICKSHTFFNISLNLERPCNFLLNQFGFEIPTSQYNVTYGNATTTYFYDRTFYNADIVIEEPDDIEKAWLENTATKEKKEIEFLENNELLISEFPTGFSANTLVIKSPTNESVNITEPLFFNSSLPEEESVGNIEICNFKNCKKGAVSVTIDDYFTACMPELEQRDFRGTYYLSETGNYSEELWNEFREGREKGHEIGTHTQSHLCVAQGIQNYEKDIQRNLDDITFNLNISEEDIISHSYPCGFETPYKQKIIEDFGFLSSRGYNINELESHMPANYFKLKSVNDEGYPGGDLNPPDYFELIDRAQRERGWAILSFHSYCNDMGAIEYLTKRNIWVDTVGNVVEYTLTRDNARIENYTVDSSAIKFNVAVNESAEETTPLSLKIRIPDSGIESIVVDDESLNHTFSKDFAGRYAIFEVSNPRKAEVEIIK